MSLPRTSNVFRQSVTLVISDLHLDLCPNLFSRIEIPTSMTVCVRMPPPPAADLELSGQYGEDDTIFVILILAATLLFAAVLADWLAVKLLCPSNMLHSNKSSEPDVQRMAPLELPKSVLYHTPNKCAATPRAAAAPVLQIDHAPSAQSTSSPWDSFLCCLPLAPPLNEMNRAAMPHQPTSNRTRIIQRSIQQPPSSPASVMVDLAHSSPVLLRKAAQQPSSPSSPASAMPNMAPSSSRPTAILSVTTPIGSVFVERWPQLAFCLLHITALGGEYDDNDDIPRCLKVQDAALGLGEPMLVLYDFSSARLPPMILGRKLLQHCMRWADKNAPEWDTQVQGIAFVLPNPFVRSFCNMVTKTVSPPQPIQYCADEVEAIAFLGRVRTSLSYRKKSYSRSSGS